MNATDAQRFARKHCCPVSDVLEFLARLYVTEHAMKAAEFQVVAEVRRAAQGQLSFYDKMMAAKTAGANAQKPVKRAAAAEKSRAKKK